MVSDEAVEPRANGWIVRLACVGLAVTGLSAAVFYYTARDLLWGRGSAANAAGLSRVVDDPSRNVVSLEHGLSLFATNCAACHGET
jgi:mono/diheme cytochrome c family protein